MVTLPCYYNEKIEDISMKNKLLTLLSATLLTTSVEVTTLQAQPNTQQKQQKPFLIQGKLPHLTMMVKMLWNDEDLALTPKQKEALLKIRKETISQAQMLGRQIFKLENQIVEASNHGANPENLKDDVFKLAELRAKATMVHLECIYNTRKILTKDQLYILE